MPTKKKKRKEKNPCILIALTINLKEIFKQVIFHYDLPEHPCN